MSIRLQEKLLVLLNGTVSLLNKRNNLKHIIKARACYFIVTATVSSLLVHFRQWILVVYCQQRSFTRHLRSEEKGEVHLVLVSTRSLLMMIHGSSVAQPIINYKKSELNTRTVLIIMHIKFAFWFV